jgi:hypothetical protein
MNPSITPSARAVAASVSLQPAVSPVRRRYIRAALSCVVLAAAALLAALTTQRVLRLVAGSPIVRTVGASGTVWVGEDGVLRSRVVENDTVTTKRFLPGDTAPIVEARPLGGDSFERMMFERAWQNDLLAISGDRAALYDGRLLRTYRLAADRASLQDSTPAPRPASMVLFDAGYVAMATQSGDTTIGLTGEFDVTLALLDPRLRQVGYRRVRADAVSWPVALRSHGPFLSLITRRGDSTMIEVVDTKQPRTRR